MKVKKFLLMFFFIFLLTGCTVDYELDITNELVNENIDRIEKLRKNEDELYREYVGKWLLAKATDDTQLKQKIRNVSEGVFSLETDRRRNLILQDIWEYDKWAF